MRRCRVPALRAAIAVQIGEPTDSNCSLETGDADAPSTSGSARMASGTDRALDPAAAMAQLSLVDGYSHCWCRCGWIPRTTRRGSRKPYVGTPPASGCSVSRQSPHGDGSPITDCLVFVRRAPSVLFGAFAVRSSPLRMPVGACLLRRARNRRLMFRPALPVVLRPLLLNDAVFPLIDDCERERIR